MFGVMKNIFRRVGLYVAAGFVSIPGWHIALPQAPSSGTATRRAYDGPMNKVLLRDYDPKSNLVVPEHHPAKAKFPVIDVHVHPSVRTPQEVAGWVKAMDDSGVEMAVLMTGAVGDAFDRLVDLYLKPYPSTGSATATTS